MRLCSSCIPLDTITGVWLLAAQAVQGASHPPSPPTHSHTQEYGSWLRKLAKARRAYAEAYRNEDNETMAAYGYEVGSHKGSALRFS